MWHQFTAAAERALRYAGGWSDRTGCDELEAVPLLVGLLSEPECRAATMLARLAIDIPTICQRWPNLAEIDPLREGVLRKPFSREVEVSLELARSRLAVLPKPLELATEHVLLGLASADHDVGVWLRQRGLEPEMLEAEILRLYGYRPDETVDAGLPAADESRPDISADPSEMFRPGTCAERTDPAVSPDIATLRILDAAANRTREGLRVIEDYVRFVLDDRHLTDVCKQLRHDLTQALGQIAVEHRLAARETQADVGTALTAPTEQSRADLTSVLAASFGRLQESLRSLEEFGKLLDPAVAAVCKQLRYRTYTVQRAVEITRGSIERLAAARLYVLIDGRPSAAEFERLARALIDAGVDVLQLRDKRLGDRELLERARLLRSLTQGTQTIMVVNDRPDLAALSRADGVHVGQDELSVKDVRAVVGPEVLVGVSAHSIEQARQAVLDGANYLGVGPTFPSGTKQFDQFPGVELLRQVAAEIRLPAFAIGGIDRQNLAEVLAAGFTRIAVSGAVTAAEVAEDPAQAARDLLSRLA